MECLVVILRDMHTFYREKKNQVGSSSALEKAIDQKYIVKLTETERSQLKELISCREASARQIRRACILLKSDSSGGVDHKKADTKNADF